MTNQFDHTCASLRQSIEGACAEKAVASALGVPWPREVIGDVGPFHVRWTRRLDGPLIVLSEDDDDMLCLLVVKMSMREFGLVGVARAGDAKRPEFKRQTRNGSTAYFVPQTHLTPIEEIAAIFPVGKIGLRRPGAKHLINGYLRTRTGLITRNRERLH